MINALAVIEGLDLTVLVVQGGVAGAVLAWFMFRTESRLKAIEAAEDRMARAHLLLVISMHQSNETAKQEARAIVREIDDAHTREK